MQKRHLAIGFLSGAALGSVIALLYAPQKGKHLRAQIRRKSSEVADGVNEYVRDTSNAMWKVLKKTKQTA